MKHTPPILILCALLLSACEDNSTSQNNALIELKNNTERRAEKAMDELNQKQQQMQQDLEQLQQQ